MSFERQQYTNPRYDTNSKPQEPALARGRSARAIGGEPALARGRSARAIGGDTGSDMRALHRALSNVNNSTYHLKKDFASGTNDSQGSEVRRNSNDSGNSGNGAANQSLNSTEQWPSMISTNSYTEKVTNATRRLSEIVFTPAERCHKTGMLNPEDAWSKGRRKVESILLHRRFEPAVGFVVLANFIVIALEADLNAKSTGEMPMYVRGLNLTFIAIYAMEALMRLYVERMVYFRSAWNNFDMIIVICGITGEAVEGAMDSVSVLRTVRLLRLLRMARLFVAFQELWALIRGLMGCLRTLVWAFGLLLTMLTVWSIFAVELIQPYMQDINQKYPDAWETCGWCPTAFDSVMQANLTFFQIMSGDGWSVLARPIIEDQPWTATIFLGVIFTMAFGLLNLITAVIVDNAAQGRLADVKQLALEREAQKKSIQDQMLRLCETMDTDKSGSISLRELKTAAKEIPEFLHLLRIMDIAPDELEYVFEILDVDMSGDVSYHEFADQLWKMKAQESHTVLMFVKHYVQQLWKGHRQMQRALEEEKRFREANPKVNPVNDHPIAGFSNEVSGKKEQKEFCRCSQDLHEATADLRGLLGLLLPYAENGGHDATAVLEKFPGHRQARYSANAGSEVGDLKDHANRMCPTLHLDSKPERHSTSPSHPQQLQGPSPPPPIPAGPALDILGGSRPTAAQQSPGSRAIGDSELLEVRPLSNGPSRERTYV